MNRSPFIRRAIGVCYLLGCIGVILWSVHRRRLAEALARDTAKQEAQAHSELDREQARLKIAKRTQADLQAAVRRSAAQAAAAASKTKRPDFAMLLSTHPKLLASFEKAAGLFLDQIWGSTFQRLNLSSDQIDKVKAAMLQSMEDQMDINAAARGQGLAYDDPAVQKMRDQNEQELHAAEQSILSSEAYASLNAVQQMQPVRNVADMVSYMSTYSSSPLTGGQTQQLTELLARSSTSYQAGGKADVDTVNWSAVLTQAPSFFAPSQMPALQGAIETWQADVLMKQFASGQGAK